jgi:hypothetical protein
MVYLNRNERSLDNFSFYSSQLFTNSILQSKLASSTLSAIAANLRPDEDQVSNISFRFSITPVVSIEVASVQILISTAPVEITGSHTLPLRSLLQAKLLFPSNHG